MALANRAQSPIHARAGTTTGITAARPAVQSIAKLLLLLIAQLPLLHASPIGFPRFYVHTQEEQPLPVHSPTLWIYMVVAIALVLLGGAFAGLTIALMGQDEIYLQVIKTSGDGSERKHATRVLRLLERGKHWVLVTLLLGNVITNETLPIVIDRSLGGGWPAVLGIIFGEIIPQSICVRHGLPIGAWMSPLVLILMYILAPVAWPTAKLLDRLLGKDHGTTYKKAGLKTLVTLHKSLGAAGEQLNQDEVTIISAVLDLKEKPVGSIMTSMKNVFTMSADTVLDEKTMEVILGAGYSRIPIHAPDNKQNFVGMLLVKILITYDPEDCKRVRDFALATLPETRAETSCLDIVNFFQEGKSHMVLVSEFPGEDRGALGVVTLEDVIEELIGEEIIDESDVFIDVHRNIRRMTPAPKSRVPKGEFVTDPDDTLADGEENLIDMEEEQKDPHQAMRRTPTTDGHPLKANGSRPDMGASPKRSSYFRRTSSVQNSSDREISQKKPMNPEMREHLKHLGPSNLASRPRSTRYNTVKIKPGAGSLVEGTKLQDTSETPRADSTAAQGGVGAGLVNSAGKDAKDGVLAVQAGYGSIEAGSPPSPKNSRRGKVVAHAEQDALKSRQTSNNDDDKPTRTSRGNSQSTIGSMHSGGKSPTRVMKRGTARSGSITENIVDAGGIKKTVLEMTSSSDDPEGSAQRGDGREDDGGIGNGKENVKAKGSGGKKKRRRKRVKGREGEDTPLIGGEDT
ncbi:MAG: hypothetical protein Q9164_001745 [Protoblastenia rupestris]